MSESTSQCADQAVAQYLLTGTPPADGTVCTQDFVPFAEPSPAAAPVTAAVAAKRRARASLISDILLKSIR